MWREASATEDLADALIGARTEDERKSRIVAEKEIVTPELVQTLLKRGESMDWQADAVRAQAVVQFAMTVAEQIKDQRGVARSWYHLGHIHLSRSDYAQGIDCLKKSAVLCEQVGDREGVGWSLNDIGAAHLSQSNYGLALQYYLKSMKVKETLPDKSDLAATLGNVGYVYAWQGNYARALEYYEKSLMPTDAAGGYKEKVRLANALSNMGQAYLAQHAYAKALEVFERGRLLFEEAKYKLGVVESFNNIGDVHVLEGNPSKAIAAYREALKLGEAINDRAAMSQALNNLGRAHAQQKEYAQALVEFQRGAMNAEAIGFLDAAFRGYQGLGDAYRELGQHQQALAHYKKAIATIETMRELVAGGEQDQQRFFEDKVSPYYALVELLIEQGQLEAAFDLSERAKARVLMDVLQGGRVNVNKAMTAEQQEQERRLNDELASLSTQISRENLQPQPNQHLVADLTKRLQEARFALEVFRSSLYAEHPELKVQRGQAKTVSLSEARSLLPDPEAAGLLAYVIGEKSQLFVLTKSGLRVYPLNVDRKVLVDKVKQFREQIAHRDNRAGLSARNLYNQLLKPALAQLRGKKTLCIVPDGPLWELPFQALQSTADHYLLDDHEIFYAPSLTVLREMIRRPSRKRQHATLLAMANPTLGEEAQARMEFTLRGDRIATLPESEKEAKALTRIYKARSRVYIGSEAREDRAKAEAKDYRIIHFATHGIMNDASPMYSQIVLAPTEGDHPEDGLLEAWELMKMDLNADLVVLSACDTARGRVSPGEGVIGLTWALFVAGCPSTVVSQWKVADASTSQLMVEFHRNLLSASPERGARRARHRSQSAMTKVAALRQAALKLRRSKKYADPFYWAPFVLIGDWR